jgi:hypothetical protein
MTQSGLVEGRRDRQHLELAGRPHDQERPADHVLLGDRAVTVVGRAHGLGIAVPAQVQARVGGVQPVVPHDPQPPRRHDDVEGILRRLRPGGYVGRLVQRDAVDGDLAAGSAALHVVPGQPDDALDVVDLARCGPEQAADSPEHPAHRVVVTADCQVVAGRGRLDGPVPGSGAVEDDDVAAVDRPQVIHELVDQDLVADQQGVFHRSRRDEERLDHECLQ